METMTEPKNKPKRNDASAKIDAEIIRKARLITDQRGVHMAEYLSQLLRPLVERDYQQFKKQLADEDKPKPREK